MHPSQEGADIDPKHCGILLFAHGARDPRWAQPFEAVANAIRDRNPDLPVRLAFLEFMSPSLLEAGAGLAATGIGQVSIVPMFLGAGGHVRKDLPQLLEQLKHSHPSVEWTLQPAIGEQSSVVQAMAHAVLSSLGERREPSLSKQTDTNNGQDTFAEQT